ncbi:hypothetical protein HDU76_012665 [Blyttiomyces sp. JEL0837]|nr:hypothetical protein HDU76_012665 [Blyttiomyces sp. JEL0837]
MNDNVKLKGSSGKLICKVLGVDQSERAIQLARLNARKSGLESQVKFIKCDIFDDGQVNQLLSSQIDHDDHGGGFDLVVSNPPYIPRHEYNELDLSVSEWEDPAALIADKTETGIEFYERISWLACQRLLKPQDERVMIESPATMPQLVMEIGGMKQVEPVERILRCDGFDRVSCWRDLAGVPRVMVGWYPTGVSVY